MIFLFVLRRFDTGHGNAVPLRGRRGLVGFRKNDAFLAFAGVPSYANLPHSLTPHEGVCDTDLFRHVMRDKHLRKGLLEKILNISFLRYVDGKEAEGAFTKEIDAAIKEIKEHAEVRREYMTLELELRREVKKRYAEGIAIGREEGREEGVISALRNLINRLGLSSEKAMDALDIPAADRAKYAVLLRN